MLPEPFGRWWRAALCTAAPREALCGTVATTTVTGWTYDTGAANIKCAASDCAVGVSGADRDTCFNENVCSRSCSVAGVGQHLEMRMFAV